MADYEPDHVEFAKIMVSPGAARMSRHFAKEAMVFAKAISPDAKPLRRGYIASFEIQSNIQNLTTQYPTLRACADLVNTARYAVQVELGWHATGVARAGHGHDGYHVLGQTAAFIGDPMTPTGELG